MTESYVNGFVDGGDLFLLQRKPDGSLVAKRKRAEYSAFIHKSKLDAALSRELRESDSIIGFNVEGEYVRICWKDAELRRFVAQDHRSKYCRVPDCDHYGYFHRMGIEVYEGDVHPMRRFFSETGAEIATPRRIFLDIETDSRKSFAEARDGNTRVLSWALVDADAQLIDAQLLEEETDASECILLESLWAKLDPFDQIVSWNGDSFDFPVIKSRSEYLNCKSKDTRRWLYLDHMEAFEKLNTASQSGDEKQSLKLDSVCMKLIGEGKDDFDSSKTYESWKAGGLERQRMLQYNIKDTMLMAKLEKKTGYLDILQKICELCRLFPETLSLQSTMQVDGYMLRVAKERGHRFGTKKMIDDGEVRKQFAGAYVKDPAVFGIGKNIHVADFASMYPSIIMSWNMSPETKRDIPINGPIPDGHCRSPSNRIGFTTTVQGLLSGALLGINSMRDFWKKKKAQTVPGSVENIEADRIQTTYKVIANSFYGVLGSPSSRYFNWHIAEAVSQNGVWLIHRVEYEANERRMPVVYIDTDAIYASGTSVEEFSKFVSWCNDDLFPRLLKENGCKENYIKLEYEKAYERIVFCGAKKYAARLLHYKHKAPDENSEPEIKGLEYKRGDSTAMAREFQKRVIDMLMKEKIEDPDAFTPMILEQRRRILEEPLAIDDIKISKAIQKPLKDYSQKMKKDGSMYAQPAHVVFAKRMKERGEEVREGTKIEYYVTDGDSTPQKYAMASEYKGDADRKYVWEEQVYKPTWRLLKAAFPGDNWDQFNLQKVKKFREKSTDVQQDLLFGASNGNLSSQPPEPPKPTRRHKKKS